MLTYTGARTLSIFLSIIKTTVTVLFTQATTASLKARKGVQE